jgi:hypothetical protein
VLIFVFGSSLTSIAVSKYSGSDRGQIGNMGSSTKSLRDIGGRLAE